MNIADARRLVKRPVSQQSTHCSSSESDFAASFVPCPMALTVRREPWPISLATSRVPWPISRVTLRVVWPMVLPASLISAQDDTTTAAKKTSPAAIFANGMIISFQLKILDLNNLLCSHFICHLLNKHRFRTGVIAYRLDEQFCPKQPPFGV